VHEHSVCLRGAAVRRWIADTSRLNIHDAASRAVTCLRGERKKLQIYAAVVTSK
jgi:hypothetical protein